MINSYDNNTASLLRMMGAAEPTEQELSVAEDDQNLSNNLLDALVLSQRVAAVGVES
jgi:hypothetical protein